MHYYLHSSQYLHTFYAPVLTGVGHEKVSPRVHDAFHLLTWTLAESHAPRSIPCHVNHGLDTLVGEVRKFH